MALKMIIFTSYFLSLLCLAADFGLETDPNALGPIDEGRPEPVYSGQDYISTSVGSAGGTMAMYVGSKAYGNTMAAAQAAEQNPLLLGLYPMLFRRGAQTHFPSMMTAFLRHLHDGLQKYKTILEEAKGNNEYFFKRLGLPRNIIVNLLDKQKEFKRSPLPCESSGEDLTLQKLGVYLYTCESEKGGPYKFLNQVLSRADVTKRWPQAAAIMAYIWDSIRDLHSKQDPSLLVQPSSYGTVLYRGMNLPRRALPQIDKFQSGFFFRFPAFVSSSEDREAALEFCKDEKTKEISCTSVLFEIHIPNEPRTGVVGAAAGGAAAAGVAAAVGLAGAALGPLGFVAAPALLGLAAVNKPAPQPACQLQAIRIESLSAIPTECEILFLPYHKFVVTDILPGFAGYRAIQLLLVDGPSAA